jgi:hypothetical protein
MIVIIEAIQTFWVKKGTKSKFIIYVKNMTYWREHSYWNITQLCDLVNRLLLKCYQLASPLTAGFVRVTFCCYVKVCDAVFMAGYLCVTLCSYDRARLCDPAFLWQGSSEWRCVLMIGRVCVTLRYYDRARLWDAVFLWLGASVWRCVLMTGCVCVTLCSYDRARLCDAVFLW